MWVNQNSFDICFVTYNSAKWIDMCINAVKKLKYDHKELTLIFVDNNSTDNTIELLETKKKELAGIFADFIILPQKDNKGFGAGNNIAVKNGISDNIFLLNIDTEIHPDALSVLSDTIKESDPSYGAFELRQMPLENCKYYDPITMDTYWASGACVVIKRAVFEEVGGFDESIFMYSEDVDLSWNIRAHGYKIKYVPGAVVNHYTNYEGDNPKISEQIGSFAGRLTLSYKYGSDRQVDYQETTVRRTLAYPTNNHFVAALRDRIQTVCSNKEYYRSFYRQNIEHNPLINGDLAIRELDEIRTGAFERLDAITNKCADDFTLVMRVSSYPELLEVQLLSLLNQTMNSFKVIVVENGKSESAKEVVERYKSKLDITYCCLGYDGNSSDLSNKGVELATTKHICFIEEDIYFFADYFEIMTDLIRKNPDKAVYISDGMRVKGSYEADSGRNHLQYSKQSKNLSNVTRDDLFYDEVLPIQSFVFLREAILKMGGFDSSFGSEADRELVLRILINGDIALINKATYLYVDEGHEQEVNKDFAGSFVEEYRKEAGIVRTEKPDNSVVVNDENILTVIRPYREEESPVDVFNEIKHTKSWLVTFPLRLLSLPFKNLLGKNDPFTKEKPGPVIWPWKEYSKSERERIVDEVLTSKMWKITQNK